jgi:preprotein translocase subunit SecF
VAGLLFVGAGLLGVGTLKDLALVLFVGMLTGAYSSLFLATPWLVDLKMFDQRYRLHAQRVLAKRVAVAKGEAVETKTGRPRAKAGARASAAGTAAAADDDGGDGGDASGQDRMDTLAAASAPRVGAKPAGTKPPGGRPGQPRKRSGGSKRR